MFGFITTIIEFCGEYPKMLHEGSPPWDRKDWSAEVAIVYCVFAGVMFVIVWPASTIWFVLKSLNVL